MSNCFSQPDPVGDALDSAWNSVTVSSLAFHAERCRLGRALAHARAQGLTLEGLVDAAQLDEATVVQLLDEVA